MAPRNQVKLKQQATEQSEMAMNDERYLKKDRDFAKSMLLWSWYVVTNSLVLAV